MKIKQLLIPALLIIFLVLSNFFIFRIDLTTDKRFSISKRTKDLLKNTSNELIITVYLDGDLNPGFLRLKNSTVEMLDEMSNYSKKNIRFTTENPSLANNTEERNKRYADLEQLGMTPTAIYERDKEGKSIQKIVFPWLKITYNNKSTYVNLLKNIRGNSGEENLNISIENLEFEITDAIRRLVNSKIDKIAFIEGHDELTEAETYDISKSLSRYFQIDRGVLGTDATILADYKVIIIAKPTKPFSESDKFIIDQYIMNGGNVIWLVDGVRISRENLATTGISPALELDLNLSDQLFNYGVRIKSAVIQDVQCVSIPVNIAPANETPQFEPTPWFFGPLLLTSSQHPITRNITEVKADFSSMLELVGENPEQKSTLLLATSDNSHLINTPATIDVSETPKQNDNNYFNMSYLPVAILLEGNFISNFANRLTPKNITNSFAFKNKSLKTKQIFVADGDIIRNETSGIASDSTTFALGYDRFMNQQYGNKDFIQNSVLYLTDKDGWFELRSRTLKMRLLNKKIIVNDSISWQLLNVLLPLILLIIAGFWYQIIRKRKYTK